MILMGIGDARDKGDEHCEDGDCKDDSEDIVAGNASAMTAVC